MPGETKKKFTVEHFKLSVNFIPLDISEEERGAQIHLPTSSLKLCARDSSEIERSTYRSLKNSSFASFARVLISN